MTVEEAANINCNRILDSIKFMLEMSTKGIFLDCLGFEYSRSSKLSGQDLRTKLYSTELDCELAQNYYNYCATPYINSKMGSNLLLVCSTGHTGTIRGIKRNTISYDTESKEFGIDIKHSGTTFDVYTSNMKHRNHENINDITDEAELFQYSLMDNPLPEYIFEFAKKMLTMQSISTNADWVSLKSAHIIIDLEILDLEAEFNRKQQGFCNF